MYHPNPPKRRELILLEMCHYNLQKTFAGRMYSPPSRRG